MRLVTICLFSTLSCVPLVAVAAPAAALTRNTATQLSDYEYAREVIAKGTHGDSGSTGHWLRQVDSLGKALGKPALPAKARKLAVRRGLMTEIAHGLHDAHYCKRDGRGAISLGLDRAMRAAIALKLTQSEIRAQLAEWQLDEHDLAAHSEYVLTK